ncbi:MAG: amino acid permease [Chlorobi bacterium]|nr:amino acid permease [Chlorobiota bacterium]
MKSEKLGLKELIAMGVGGMVGGGIFSVLGLSVGLAGHAAPIAFLIGGVIATLTGFSYSKLGLEFRSDGGSFTYMEKSVGNKNVAAIGGWLLLVGYIGTLALYSYTFGVYGTAMAGSSQYSSALRHFFASFIILVFLGINLYGIKTASHTEVLIVITKLIILLLFAGMGLFFVKENYILPVFNKSSSDLFVGAALIFVAYEGFELIPNTINEMKNPDKNLTRSIMLSILITIIVYVLVSFVAVGNLTPDKIAQSKEYALAEAAKPFLGRAGFVLIGIGALLSTASAINATLFGTARLGMAMAQEEDLPKIFSFKERTKNIPWVSLTIISLLTLIFVNIADLTLISSFASSTFLLIFIFINFSAIKLSKRIKIKKIFPFLGLLLSGLSWIVLVGYIWNENKNEFIWLGVFYAAVVLSELLFSERRIFFKSNKKNK